MVHQRVARSQRLAWLEGVRIVAAVMLLLYHAQLLFTGSAYTPQPTGLGDNLQQVASATAGLPAYGGLTHAIGLVTWFGFQFIDVFVLLSGFSLVLSLTDQPCSPGTFLKQRLPRILCPFWAVAWLSYPILWAIAVATERDFPSPWQVFAGITFPLLYQYDGDLLSATNGAWWLMSLVLAFSLLFPVCWWLLQRWGAANLLLLSTLLTVSYRLVAVYVFGGHPTYVLWDSPAGWQPFALFVAKLSTFVVGMAAGHAYTKRLGPVFWNAQKALSVAVPVYILGFLCQFSASGWVLADLLTPIGLTLIGMVVFRAIVNQFRIEPLLLWLGHYSYSYFLVHGIVVDAVLQLVVQGDLLRYYLLLPVMVVGTFMLAVLTDYASPLLWRMAQGVWRDLDYVLVQHPTLPPRLWNPRVGDPVLYRGQSGWTVTKVEKLLDEQDMFLCQVSDGRQSLWVNEQDLEPSEKGGR